MKDGLQHTETAKGQKEKAECRGEKNADEVEITAVGVKGDKSVGEKESEHCTACHWPPGVNNPSQIDLPARPSRAF